MSKEIKCPKHDTGGGPCYCPATAVNKYVNSEKTSTGKVRAVCECCGERSKATDPDINGEPLLHRIGSGWTETPFSHDVVHEDGSTGSFFTCPVCTEKLYAGQILKTRNYDA